MSTIESCTCKTCISYCQNAPGWMTPEEAEKAIEQGYAQKLMIDWWDGREGPEFVLCPATFLHEGGRAPSWEEMTGGDFIRGILGNAEKGECTLLKNNRCSVHDSGWKPIQCRTAIHTDHTNALFFGGDKVAQLWNTDKGREVLKRWKVLVKFNDASLQDI